jgi:hypothetical protein
MGTKMLLKPTVGYRLWRSHVGIGVSSPTSSMYGTNCTGPAISV